jgi:hypothetical protein
MTKNPRTCDPYATSAKGNGCKLLEHNAFDSEEQLIVNQNQPQTDRREGC